jgi:hypothetical protein
MRRHTLLFLLLAVGLSACGGSDSNPSGPGTPPKDTDTPVDTDPPADGGDGGDNPTKDTGDPVTELVSGLTAPRDLTFGPAGSDLEDELFVVHFEGVEATWIKSVDTGPVQQRFENSLVGAIAVDMDPASRFYFACLIPIMGASRGVITVRTFDGSIPDFQYTGIDEPSGVAVDAEGGLFVFNRGSRSVVRIDFADGAASDRHGVEVIAENLAVSDEILPSHLLVDGSGRLLIIETPADRVLMWAEEEITIFADATSGLAQPVGIALLPTGNVLVANYGDGLLVEFDSAGTLVRTFDTELGENRLQAVAVRGDGAVFIVDDEGGFGGLYRINFDSQ